MLIIPSGLEIFRSQNTKDLQKLFQTLVYVIVAFDAVYSKLSYSSYKVQYFAAKNVHYYTLFPKLKRSLAKIVNLGFSV